MNQKGLMSEESLTASALMLLVACLSHPAWSQESTGLKKTRIGMPNQGVPNLGLPAAQRFGFFQAQGLAAELTSCGQAFPSKLCRPEKFADAGDCQCFAARRAISDLKQGR